MARTEEFDDGALKVRQPSFRTVQAAGGPRSYEKLSVLDSNMPNQNGTDTAGLERKKMGIQHSAVGTSTSTFDQRLWIRNTEQFSRARPPEDENG